MNKTEIEALERIFTNECTKWEKCDGGSCGVRHINITPEQMWQWILSNCLQKEEEKWISVEINPTEYGKYFVHRKDGKVHWETWNGSGWAYNGNVITHWKEIQPPVK